MGSRFWVLEATKFTLLWRATRLERNTQFHHENTKGGKHEKTRLSQPPTLTSYGGPRRRRDPRKKHFDRINRIHRIGEKSCLEINMPTRSSEADKPFDSTQGHEHCRMASLSLLLVRVASVPRLRLWTQALPEIPRRILIYMRTVPLDFFPYKIRDFKSLAQNPRLRGLSILAQ